MTINIIILSLLLFHEIGETRKMLDRISDGWFLMVKDGHGTQNFLTNHTLSYKCLKFIFQTAPIGPSRDELNKELIFDFKDIISISGKIEKPKTDSKGLCTDVFNYQINFGFTDSGYRYS